MVSPSRSLMERRCEFNAGNALLDKPAVAPSRRFRHLNQNAKHSYTLRRSLSDCHSERSEESVFETLRFTQGDTRGRQARDVCFRCLFA